MISCQVSQVVQMSHCHIVWLHTSSQDELKRCIQAGWHSLFKAGPLLGGFFQFVRIFQASKGESQAILIRQKAVLSTQSQVLNPFLSPQSSISPQFSILNSSVFNPQFSILNHQFSILSPQFSLWSNFATLTKFARGYIKCIAAEEVGGVELGSKLYSCNQDAICTIYPAGQSSQSAK